MPLHRTLPIVLVLLALCCRLTLVYPSTAIDWGPSDYNFPTQTSASTDYDETRQNIRLRVTRRSGDDLSVEPNTLYSITGGPPPITNSSPFPSVEVTGTANASNPRMVVRITDSASSDSVLAPGESFFIGGFDLEATTNLFVDRVRFSQVGVGGLMPTNLMTATNYDVNTTDTADLTWSATGTSGSITFTPGTGRSGVLFLKNTSGVALDRISFRVRYAVTTSLYFGTTTPEPSTYLTLAGGLIVIAFLARRRIRKA